MGKCRAQTVPGRIEVVVESCRNPGLAGGVIAIGGMGRKTGGSMRMCWITAVIGLGYGICAPAFGAVYQLPLNDLVGVYSTGDLGPQDKNITFDFGRRFERIDDVRIHVKGTVAPGLWDLHSLVDESDRRVEILPRLDFFVRSPADHSRGGFVTIEDEGAFELELPFRHIFTSNWDFLREGASDLDFQLEGPTFTADKVARQIVPSVAGIEAVRLIIEGQIVPEPAGASVLLLSLSAVALRRRHRN
jgi:hypothetical protein